MRRGGGTNAKRVEIGLECGCHGRANEASRRNRYQPRRRVSIACKPLDPRANLCATQPLFPEVLERDRGRCCFQPLCIRTKRRRTVSGTFERALLDGLSMLRLQRGREHLAQQQRRAASVGIGVMFGECNGVARLAANDEQLNWRTIVFVAAPRKPCAVERCCDILRFHKLNVGRRRVVGVSVCLRSTWWSLQQQVGVAIPQTPPRVREPRKVDMSIERNGPLCLIGPFSSARAFNRAKHVARNSSPAEYRFTRPKNMWVVTLRECV